MNKKNLVILGTPGAVSVLLLAANAAPRIARMSADDDGQQVAFDLIPEAKAGETIDYKLADDSDTPTTSIIIAIPATDKFLVVENVRMNEPAAEAIAATAAQLYTDGLVANSGSPEIYAPTPNSAYDRISVRDSDGKKVQGIELIGIDGDIRVTGATAYADDQRNQPVIALAAIGQPKVYEYDPTTLQAHLAFELDSPVVRATRSEQDGSVAFKLEDGRTAKVSVDSDGKLKLAGIEDAKTDEVPEIAQGWQAIGRSYAVTDEDGAPTIASVRPSASDVEFRFAPAAKVEAAPSAQ